MFKHIITGFVLPSHWAGDFYETHLWPCFVLFNGFFQSAERSSCLCFRSILLQMLFKIGVPKNFTNFTGKHLCWSLLSQGLQLYLKSGSDTEHLWWLLLVVSFFQICNICCTWKWDIKNFIFLGWHTWFRPERNR